MVYKLILYHKWFEYIVVDYEYPPRENYSCIDQFYP
jgi:hypothetical protein